MQSQQDKLWRDAKHKIEALTGLEEVKNRMFGIKLIAQIGVILTSKTDPLFDAFAITRVRRFANFPELREAIFTLLAIYLGAQDATD